ncbi:probable leucine-rich repeat receptor-like serine/threonine-protein kinase At3g14840 isoform X2 [Diospyros lotus]|nr:probable leucine-rich repeat receptor-like serine/threonine-protein kinase At3g14840 isoform X2 [Diospyros lotus]
MLPPDLVGLPYLKEIDLSRNHLEGFIPEPWGRMKLVNISVIVNKLTGSIPKELGNISTLANLALESNQLSGAIPPEIGNLSHLEKLHLSSNNFTGELPRELAKLTNLKDFRISDNNFTGKIPDFIQNWTNLQKIVMHASGLEGPIPPGIALLTQVSDLRISDLHGPQSSFPQLNNMSSLKYLILRSCNLNGSLPKYLGTMENLKTLDLSFNKLSGEIPSSFSSLEKIDNIYLTGNLLSGPVPDWMLKGANVDLSLNNFSSGSQACQQNNTNLFGSSLNDSTGISLCLMSTQCKQTWSSFHINCGGNKVNVDSGTNYEADTTDLDGSSRFSGRGSNWAFSSTGYFMDDDRNSKSFIQRNTTRLSVNDSELYMDARLSPLSLVYYGFCLRNETYKVRLHFAEIMFTDGKNYSSLGRRVFDVYIQGKLVEKDFNIVDRAGGAGKSIAMPYKATVTSGTLEIRFYWAGRGTTAVPVGGVYGPLISAISVDPDSIPPSGGNIMSTGAVVGVVAAAAFAIILLLVILWWRGCLGCKDTMDEDLKGLDLQTGSFTLRQIKAATNNFDAANKIGEGGFGSVYKGVLRDGTIIAVKQLSSKSKQGNREFVNEIGMISALQHPHLVKLYGCCIAGSQLFLVYEYMENNSLARALFGPKELQLKLDWPTRYKICIGIARALAFLHEESRLKIVHRDIKTTNVLLDKNLKSKISDFGLAKLDDEDHTHISTRIAGTYGYMAPEYALHGYLTDKADVYSFGIVALELVSGRSNASFKPKEPCFNLLDRAIELKGEGKLMELMDPKLGSDFNKDEAMVMINVALLCTNIAPSARPAMSLALSMLEGRTIVIKEPVSDRTDSIYGQMKVKGEMDDRKLSNEGKMTDGQVNSISLDGSFIASSMSVGDLYPANLDSDYWEKRD